jgi:uncharacterized protein
MRGATATTDVRLGGPLGEALDANLQGRLTHFIGDETSPAIALFAPERRSLNTEGDWYGEHAGKWLVAAAKAVARSGDPALTTSLRRVADFLVSVQEPDGYLGTYAPDRRFMQPQPPKPLSWNGEPSVRTWDIWTHAYLILGFVEAHRALGEAAWLDAARRIAALCLRTLSDGSVNINELGNHHGMSATVLLDAAVELHFATGEAQPLELAKLVLAQAEANPMLDLVEKILGGADASEIATGKAYQLLWNYTGIVKLHRATGEARLLLAAQRLWENVRAFHLTLGGGPWGGVAHRSREVFNPAGVFSPQGYVETCSVLAWIQFNRELLRTTGEAKYAEEIERSAYNDLLGAQAPDGEDWCYYSFPNGRRVHTTYWRCCKSSGAMAIEELAPLAYAVDGDAITVQLYGAGELHAHLPAAGEVVVRQETRYPFDGTVHLHMQSQREAVFTLRLRIPSWSVQPVLRINGAPVPIEIDAQGFVAVTRTWRSDEVQLVLPMTVRVQRASNRNVQESRAPDGSAVAQEVLRFYYLAMTRGPLVYATRLVDGYKIDETLRISDAPPEQWLSESMTPTGIPQLELQPLGRPALRYEPYFLAGGRSNGSWRLTWLSLAPANDDTTQ